MTSLTQKTAAMKTIKGKSGQTGGITAKEPVVEAKKVSPPKGTKDLKKSAKAFKPRVRNT